MDHGLLTITINRLQERVKEGKYASADLILQGILEDLAAKPPPPSESYLQQAQLAYLNSIIGILFGHNDRYPRQQNIQDGLQLLRIFRSNEEEFSLYARLALNLVILQMHNRRLDNENIELIRKATEAIGKLEASEEKTKLWADAYTITALLGLANQPTGGKLWINRIIQDLWAASQQLSELNLVPRQQAVIVNGVLTTLNPQDSRFIDQPQQSRLRHYCSNNVFLWWLWLKIKYKRVSYPELAKQFVQL